MAVFCPSVRLSVRPSVCLSVPCLIISRESKGTASWKLAGRKLVVFAGVGDGGICPGHWLSRYGTEWPILCLCATATRSHPPLWLYLQIPAQLEACLPITRQQKVIQAPQLAGRSSVPRLILPTSFKVKRSKVRVWFYNFINVELWLEKMPVFYFIQVEIRIGNAKCANMPKLLVRWW